MVLSPGWHRPIAASDLGHRVIAASDRLIAASDRLIAASDLGHRVIAASDRVIAASDRVIAASDLGHRVIAASAASDRLIAASDRVIAASDLGHRVIAASDRGSGPDVPGDGAFPVVHHRHMSATTPQRRLTVADITRLYRDGQRIPMLTAYDYPTARIVDEAGIPMILVGDSLGEVLLGYESTVRVSIEEMLHHTRAVVRGAQRALVVGDMPFLTYASVEEALDNAGRFMRDAGSSAVKVEGGVRTGPVIEALVKAGIPVMGHIGWTPQAKYGMGGKTGVQGKDRDQARRLISDALAVQEAGAFSVVLELMPEQLSAAITERLSIPTIGIGAGAGCSGQVQVITDLLGLGSFIPRHAKPYLHLREAIGEAVTAYAADVQAGTFPEAGQSSRMDEEVLGEVLGVGRLDQADTMAPLAIPLDRDL